MTEVDLKEEVIENKEIVYITQTDLKNRGWTNKAIKLFFPEPDMYKTNPRYRSAPPMKLYNIEKVKLIEILKNSRFFKVKTKSGC